MNDHLHHKPTFYGSATIGSKGQIVIPAEARDDLGFKPGDKVIVIGIKDRNMLGICPLDSVETMLAELTKKMETIRQIVDNEKQKEERK